MLIDFFTFFFPHYFCIVCYKKVYSIYIGSPQCNKGEVTDKPPLLPGDLGREEAKARFTSALLKAAPDFGDFVTKKSEERREEIERAKEEEEKRKEEEDRRAVREEEQQEEEKQRRAIQDALNKQTWGQFKCYAEQQCPGNPDQQVEHPSYLDLII